MLFNGYLLHFYKLIIFIFVHKSTVEHGELGPSVVIHKFFFRVISESTSVSKWALSHVTEIRNLLAKHIMLRAVCFSYIAKNRELTHVR